MDWNLEGKQVRGIYFGTTFVEGKVIDSRVKLGGRVMHTVRIDHDTEVCGDEGIPFRCALKGEHLTLLDNEVDYVDGVRYTPLEERE